MDLDWVVLWAAILLLTLIIGGTVLVYPLSRRLADLMDWHLQEKKRAGAVGVRRDKEIMDTVAALEREVTLVTERQQFLERVLEDRGVQGSGFSGQVEREASRPASDPS